jgi:dienelactone hydrolase
MHIQDIQYEVDGQRMVGQFAVDDYRRGRRPAVLVSHEGPGLDDHVRGRAVRLAGLGYAAFALDYHGEGRVLPIEQIMERLGVLSADTGLTRRLGRAGLDVLLAQPSVDPDRVAAVGFCFGGAMSLELARSGAELRAVVGFHSGFTPPNPTDSRNIRASVLMCSGADDPLVTAEQRQAFQDEMIEAGVADWQLDVYGGTMHCFTNPVVDDLGMPGLAYNPVADRRSWQSMLQLFDQTLGPV